MKLKQMTFDPITQGPPGPIFDRPLGGRVYLVTQMVPMKWNFAKSRQIEKIRVVYYKFYYI